MFGKLKDMAGAAAVDKAVAGLEPMIAEQLTKIQAIGAEIVRNDTSYAEQIVAPAYLAVTAASHGVTKLIPEFKDRFSRLMVRLRDELLLLDDNAVRLAEDCKARLPLILTETLKG